MALLYSRVNEREEIPAAAY